MEEQPSKEKDNTSLIPVQGKLLKMENLLDVRLPGTGDDLRYLHVAWSIDTPPTF